MDISKDRKRSTHIVGLRKPIEGRTNIRLYVNAVFNKTYLNSCISVYNY